MTPSRTSNAQRRPAHQKRSPRSLALTLGVTALLIVGGGLAYLLFQNTKNSGPLPLGSTLLPEDTSFSLTLTTESDAWDRLEEFDIPETRKAMEQLLTSFQTEVLAPHNLNFATDLQPWLKREMTTAILSPPVREEDILADQSQVWILPLRDLRQAQKFLTDRASTEGLEPVVHQGIEMWTSKAGTPDALTLALFDPEFLIATNDIPSMREMIDTIQTQKTLAAQERFQQAMAQIQRPNPFAQLYINLPANTSQIFEQEGRQIDQATLDRLQEFQGIGSTITLDDRGIQLTSISWLKTETEDRLNVSSNPSEAAKLLPEDTILMMAGDSFQQVWKDYQQGVETQLLLPFSPKGLQAEFQRLTGLNFEQQFLPWMTGDFASAIVPQSQENDQSAGFVFLTKTRDQTAADQALRSLESEMRSRYALQMSETRVNDRPVVIWRVPPNLPFASRGWLADKVLFFSVFTPLTERLTDPDQNSLAALSRFQAVTQSDLNPQSGKFFIDVPRLATLMQTSQFLPKLAPGYQKYAQEFEAVGGTSATPNRWSNRYDIHIQFRRK
ncbi:DUF3352 domain-containing protein [Lyngbya confervoides]|uniref:DUF3352 domain-containing protein n=1 Tax=Lyngbya confervoides BDU141951 TaxID=1574623 RepID=A0ABD4SYM6_9CYAN|nr:DUF3352 domain-containing protein [Lyngbya confervoides]MCM1981398.1 DUF3352 domain-containing protein [Lyngbya confervoides BDU141951]